MKKRHIFLLFFVVLFAISYIFPNSYRLNRTFDEAQIKADITALLMQQNEDWNNKDLEAFMEGYWKSEDMTFIGGAELRNGWQAALDAYVRNYTPESMGVLTFKDIDIEVLSADYAFVKGIFEIEYEPNNPHGRYTLIMKKFADGWKVIHDHSSSATPPKPTSANIELVEKQVEAYNALDIDAFMATYHKDIKIYNWAEPEKLRFETRKAMHDRYAKLFKDNPDQKANISNRITVGNYVIDREQVIGRANNIEVNAVAVYEIKDDLIYRVWFLR